MTKAIFKKSLALLLSVMLVLTALGGALAVFADTEAAQEGFDYGAYEDGFHTNIWAVHQVPYLSNPTNLDFAEGFKYWTSKEDRTGLASDFANLYTDDETGINSIGFKFDGAEFDGISTPKFYFANMENGTKVAFFMEYMINPDITGSFYETFGTTIVADIGIKKDTETGEQNIAGYSRDDAVANDATQNGIWQTRYMGSIDVDADAGYRIQIQDRIPNADAKAAALELLGNESAVYIRNIRVCYDNGSGVYTDVKTGAKTNIDGLPIGGTAEDGIIATNDDFVAHTQGGLDSSNYKFGVLDSFSNYDFSEGFKYYSLRYYSGRPDVDSISDFAEVTDGVLKFTGHPYDYCGFVSMPFYIEGLEKDDVIAAAMKFKGGNGHKEIRLYEGKSTKIATVGTAVSSTNWCYSATNAVAVSDPNSYFWFELQNNVDNTGLEIDEIMILKKIDDKVFENVFNGELYYGDGLPVGGSYEDGWSQEEYHNNGPTRAGSFKGIQNGDFSGGLKYWGARNGQKGSDYVTIKTEGDNVYLTHSASSATASWEGLVSNLFYLPGVKEDDKLVLMYKYRNGNAAEYQAFFSPINATNGVDGWQFGNYGSKVIQSAEGDSWGYAVTNGYVVVGSSITPQTLYGYMQESVNSAPAYRIEFSNSTPGATIDIDDFQVVKYINNYVYETLDGETIVFDPEWAGTFADGASQNLHNYYTLEYGFVNGDFEEGLKYWANKNSSYASTMVNLVTDGDNHYAQLNGKVEGGYQGFRTAMMSIPADKLAADDYVAVKYDIYLPEGETGSNVQLVLSGWEMEIPNETGYRHEIRLSLCRLSECDVIEDKGNGWKTVVSKFSRSIVTDSVATKTVKPGDWQFSLAFEIADGTSTVGFDNFELVKKISNYSAQSLEDDALIKWDPTWAGTFAEGMGSDTNHPHYTEGYGVANNDFEDGLKYWGCTAAGTNAATYVDIVTENGNTYAKFKGDTVAAYRGIVSSWFSIPADKLAIDDGVVVKYDIYDPNGDANNIQVKFDSRYPNGGASSNTMVGDSILVAEKGDWKTYLTKVKTVITAASTANATQAVAAGDWVFQVAIQIADGKASTAGIDNIELVKLTGDYSAVTLDDAEVITWAPAWAGTFEAGSKENLHNYYNHKYGVMNADFSEGLKYWGVKSVSALTDVVDLVNDNDNYFVQFNGKVEGGYKGFRTAMMSIPAADLMVGDYVSVKFDIYLPEGETGNNVQLVLCGWEMDNPTDTGYIPEIRLSQCNLNQCKVIEDKGNGWKTVVSTFNKSIVKESSSTKTVEAGDWQFAIMLEISSGTSTVGFDNFELVKLESGFGAEALIVDMNGAAVEADKVVAGDANYDGKVDLVDLVRTKKYLANVAGDGIASPISIASVAADASVGITADDITAIINKILGVVA